MRKIWDSHTREVDFYEDELDRAREYYGVEGDTIEEIVENANALELENGSGESNRYEVRGEAE